MCYNKYSQSQLLSKEHEIWAANRHCIDQVTLLSFIQFYIKSISHKFCVSLQTAKKGLWPETVIKPISDFMLEWEVITYEMCKFILADAMLKQYLKSYLSASVLITAFQVMLERTESEHLSTSAKLDLEQVNLLYQCLYELMVECFGFQKFVLF